MTRCVDQAGRGFVRHLYRGAVDLCVRCGHELSPTAARIRRYRTGESHRAGKQGFASMSAEQKHRIAQMGGKAAHAQGVAHVWTSEEAVRAGRIGGMRSKAKRAEGQHAA